MRTVKTVLTKLKKLKLGLEKIIDGVGKRFDKAVDGIKGQVKDIPQKQKH